jgi:hypothetical protein
MPFTRALNLLDIPWLRVAARPSGAVDVPPGIAAKLLAGGLVKRDVKRDCLTITPRGQLALTRLT